MSCGQSTRKLLQGVLEVKSTRKAQFSELGLRQLNDWVNRGIELRRKLYKGVFIGTNAIRQHPNERPDAFSDSFRQSAELHKYVVMTTSDLLNVLLAVKGGELEADAFWRELFSCDGTLDCSELLEG